MLWYPAAILTICSTLYSFLDSQLCSRQDKGSKKELSNYLHYSHSWEPRPCLLESEWVSQYSISGLAKAASDKTSGLPFDSLVLNQRRKTCHFYSVPIKYTQIFLKKYRYHLWTMLMQSDLMCVQGYRVWIQKKGGGLSSAEEFWQAGMHGECVPVAWEGSLAYWWNKPLNKQLLNSGEQNSCPDRDI